jgi:hypothetical protein
MSRKRTHRQHRLPRHPSSSNGRSPEGSRDQARDWNLLRTSLATAVPLWVWELYERGGPDPADFRTAHAFGRELAERGDRLLYRGSRPGETAEMFNRLARALAVMAFVPGGVPPVFGQTFVAERILAGFVGEGAAHQYCQKIVAQIPALDEGTSQEQ